MSREHELIRYIAEYKENLREAEEKYDSARSDLMSRNGFEDNIRRRMESYERNISEINKQLRLYENELDKL